MSQGDGPVLVVDDGAVRTLTLNRPDRLNAFTATSYRLLAELLVEADQDAEVHALILRGAGRAFSSGVDLDALRERPDAAAQLGETFDELLEALVTLDTPLLAAVHGSAVGFGATVLLHCDLVLVAEDARLRFPFTSLGTAPEAGSSMLLTALVGPQRAADFLFTSRWIGAAEAVSAGLALRSCPPERLEAETMDLAREVAAQPPVAVATAKRLLREARTEPLEEAFARERREARQLSARMGPMGTAPQRASP